MSYVSTPQHSLTFGSLNLIGTDEDMSELGYKIECLADQTDWGSPVPIIEKIISWLQDGAIAALNNYDNREMTVQVMVTGADSNDLARGESALMLETGKPNELVWTPPDGFGAPCVFSVVTSNLVPVMDDEADLRNEAVYQLKIEAEPFVRGQELVVVTQPAPPSGGPTVVSIDNCSSTANWDGGTDSVTTSGGAVRVQATNGSAFFGGVVLQRDSLSENLTTTPYLRIDLGYTVTPNVTIPPYALEVRGYGSTGTDVALTQVASSGSVRWYSTTGVGTTLTTLRISLRRNGLAADTLWKLWVADVSRTDSLVDSGATGRQLSRTIPVEGSARTQGTLSLQDETDALGDVLVYSAPLRDGVIQPNLRDWLSSGNTETPDSSTVSGATSDLSTLHTFDLPVSGLVPGGYLLLARVKHASTGNQTLTWAAKTRQGSTTISGGQSGSAVVALTAATWGIVTVARMNLPPRKLGNAGTVRLELQSGSGVVLDEAWAYNIETGRLSLFTVGTATPAPGASANRVWLDAPTVQSPVPALYVGTEVDRSDSYHLVGGARSLSIHEFLPPAMVVHTVTTNATETAIELSHFPRFNTRVVKSPG